MIRQIVISGLFLCSSTLARSQKIIDSIAKESCQCIEKMHVQSPGIIANDSVTHCISWSMMNHMQDLVKEKDLNPSKIGGIREVHVRVRKILMKECEVLIQNWKEKN